MSSLKLKTVDHSCVQLCLEAGTVLGQRGRHWPSGEKSGAEVPGPLLPVGPHLSPGPLLPATFSDACLYILLPCPGICSLHPQPMGPGLDQSLSSWRHCAQTQWEAFSNFSFYIQSVLLGTSFTVFIIREAETPHSPPDSLLLQPSTYCWGTEESEPSCRTRV